MRDAIASAVEVDDAVRLVRDLPGYRPKACAVGRVVEDFGDELGVEFGVSGIGRKETRFERVPREYLEFAWRDGRST